MASFFIVYPVGLEDMGLVELTEKFALYFAEDSFVLKKQIPGGLELECPLHIGLKLNTLLRSPTRILIRLGEFKCRDAPKLYLKSSKFPWAPWLIGQTPMIESSAVNSRLFDSRKIEKALGDGVLQYYRHKPVKKKYLEHLEKTRTELLPKIYFRSVDDTVTLSLDTTGERLHLRGEKTMTGLAPIRENLASLLLIHLKSFLAQDQSYTLIDPMCGSGTFLLEAKEGLENTVTTQRGFSFEHLPVVLDAPGAHLPSVVQKKTEAVLFDSLMGFDINAEVVALAKINTRDSGITIEKADLFETEKEEGKKAVVNPVVILNPPYGIRVGDKSDINLAYYLRLISAVQKNWAPKIMGIIVPSDYSLHSNQLFTILSIRPFKNGGIDVVFYVLGFK